MQFYNSMWRKQLITSMWLIFKSLLSHKKTNKEKIFLCIQEACIESPFGESDSQMNFFVSVHIT